MTRLPLTAEDQKRLEQVFQTPFVSQPDELSEGQVNVLHDYALRLVSGALSKQEREEYFHWLLRSPTAREILQSTIEDAVDLGQLTAPVEQRPIQSNVAVPSSPSRSGWWLATVGIGGLIAASLLLMLWPERNAEVVAKLEQAEQLSRSGQHDRAIAILEPLTEGASLSTDLRERLKSTAIPILEQSGLDRLARREFASVRTMVTEFAARGLTSNRLKKLAAQAWAQSSEVVSVNEFPRLADFGISLTQLYASNVLKSPEENRDYLEAAKLLDDVLASSPSDREAQLNRAYIYLRLQEPQNARALFDEILANEPDHVAAELGKGLAAYMQDDVGQATESFERVLELDPGNAAAQENLLIARRRLELEAK